MGALGLALPWQDLKPRIFPGLHWLCRLLESVHCQGAQRSSNRDWCQVMDCLFWWADWRSWGGTR